SSTPTGTSRTSLRQDVRKYLSYGRSLHSIEHCGSRTCWDREFHSPMQVQRGSCECSNKCAACVAPLVAWALCTQDRFIGISSRVVGPQEGGGQFLSAANSATWVFAFECEPAWLLLH